MKHIVLSKMKDFGWNWQTPRANTAILIHVEEINENDFQITLADGTMLTKQEIIHNLIDARKTKISDDELNNFRKILYDASRREHDNVIERFNVDFCVCMCVYVLCSLVQS